MEVASNSINNNQLSDKLLQGIKTAVRKLVEKSAVNNESLVVRDNDGIVKDIPAKEILEQMNKKVD